jgi:hypothetical protein
MFVFLDFEASSLGRHSYPIEVGWAFEDGRGESHLIRPAPGWNDWDAAAEAIHHIPRTLLLEEGEPHTLVAHRMIDQLSDDDLLASAPSWDGKWLSTLLRAAGLPRHALRLRDTETAQRDCARSRLSHALSGQPLEQAIDELVVLAQVRRHGATPRHRALADAEDERQRWIDLCDAAERQAQTITPRLVTSA